MSEDSVYERRGLVTTDRRASDRGTPDRRRGRPSITPGQRSTPMTVRVPDADYDRLCHEATQHRMELAVFVRHRLGIS